jgi:hypothetical protein
MRIGLIATSKRSCKAGKPLFKMDNNILASEQGLQQLDFFAKRQKQFKSDCLQFILLHLQNKQSNR